MSQMELKDGITLLSGKRFDYNAPGACPVEIEDIAQPLSQICRFAGQLPYFYSVAQHAVNASRIVPPEFAYTALMHDTSEAFTNDIPTPLKAAVPAFKALEIDIETAMAKRFGFTFPLPIEVMLADRQMLGLEMALIRGQDTAEHAILNGVPFMHLQPLVELQMQTPRMAFANFMTRYEELKP
jgi:hypothetical protein